VRQIRTIEQLGMIDALTNISNRRSFDETIKLEWSRARRDESPFSLLIIDVDKFKAYNDSYGHPQGDILLQTIAQIFKSAIKRSADMAARIGGEEFGILLPNTDMTGAKKIAEEIRESVKATTIPCANCSELTSITVSIGVASIIPGVDDSIDEFVRQADRMLYQAKKDGRDKVCF
jgi:diguanylate cyclase (GGDEF)-like protein